MAKKRQNIVFIAETSQLGGSDTAMEEISKELTKLGHHVRIIQGLDRERKNWSLGTSGSSIKISSYNINFNGNVAIYASIFRGIWRSLSNISSQSVDLLLLNNTFAAFVVCLHPRFWHTKKIFLIHGDDPEIMKSIIAAESDSRALLWAKRLFFYLLVTIAQFVAILLSYRAVTFSDYSLTILQKKFPFISTFKKINLGINHNDFAPITAQKKSAYRSRLGYKSSDYILLSTSRFEPRKGIHLLIKSFVQLITQFPNLKLVLATPVDSHYQHSQYIINIHSLIKNRNLKGKVRIVYNKDRKELAKLYNIADLHILPSEKLEAFGLVVLEAFASGLPVVTCRHCGAPPSLVSRISNTYIFDHFTAGSLASCIRDVLNKKDKAKDARHAKLIAKEYSWTTTAKALLTI